MSTTEVSGSSRQAFLATLAAAAGALFVWYDFFLFVALGGLVGARFLPEGGGGFGFALAAVAAGLIMRPVGALLFGRIADKRGRRRALLASLLVMGLSTLVLGLLPTRAQIGMAAPVLLIGLRLVQGLALGGAPSAGLVYVAEIAPPKQRGLYTGLIQAAGTAGLALAIGAAIAAHTALGDKAFEGWGWRIPFLVSALLLALWAWLRLRLPESPFREVETTKPLAESLASGASLKRLFLALFGVAIGPAVVAQGGQLYALSFLQDVLHVDPAAAQSLILPALAAGAPFFVLFGWLSDRIGRKWLVMAGCGLFAIAVIPLFSMLIGAANPSLTRAQANARVQLVADPKDCSVLFDPTDRIVFKRSCDIARDFLVRAGIPYKVERAYPRQMAGVQVGDCATCYVDSFRGARLSVRGFQAESDDFSRRMGSVLAHQRYPASAPTILIDKPKVMAILFALVVLAAMSGGPAGAMLAEMFPARVRGLSVSLTSQLAQGWFGGLLAASAFAIVATTGNLAFGMLYAVFFAALTVIVGAINLAETRAVDIGA